MSIFLKIKNSKKLDFLLKKCYSLNIEEIKEDFIMEKVYNYEIKIDGFDSTPHFQFNSKMVIPIKAIKDEFLSIIKEHSREVLFISGSYKYEQLDLMTISVEEFNEIPKEFISLSTRDVRLLMKKRKPEWFVDIEREFINESTTQDEIFNQLNFK